MVYARMELLEMEGKSEETKNDMENVDKRSNHFRFEADVLLTRIREWNKRMKVS